MNDLRRRRAVFLASVLGAVLLWDVGCWNAATQHAFAVSPQSIVLGKQLFEREWTPRNPALVGSDGLGPLFNAASCAGCHQQGGVGGGGQAEFNAKTVSIESMRVTGGQMTLDVVRQFVRGFHPGFIDPKAGIVNSLALSHHGGTDRFSESRQRFLEQIPALFSDKGGAANAEEVRRANATPILYSAKSQGYQATIHARLFQRNTTALFGAGLIDQVTDKQLRAIERAQRQHPEISGRLATLANGRLGRFGWRGNVPSLLAFCDRACAAEVGLETRRMDQPADPMVPAYRNPSVDISDGEIRAMASFVAALPAPARRMPDDSERLRMVHRGEQLFASIGCAVCHVPNVGPAVGVYSDLLLHDMGPKSYDLNPADPYIVRVTPVTRYDAAVSSTTTGTQTVVDDTVNGMGVGYYGGNYSMEAGVAMETTSTSQFNTAGPKIRLASRSSVLLRRNEYRFNAMPVPPVTMRIIPKGTDSKTWETTKEFKGTEERRVLGNEWTESGKDTYTVELDLKTQSTIDVTQTNYLRLTLDTTNFTQEWRTPPLWGVHDSPPYMHDGRAETLLEAITMHEGEAQGTRDRFLALSLEDRQAVIDFLDTLVAPPGAPPAPRKIDVAAK